jgi:hypothetical protein
MKYYPMELLEIYEVKEPENQSVNSVNNGWGSPPQLTIDETTSETTTEEKNFNSFKLAPKSLWFENKSDHASPNFYWSDYNY